jgi:UDP-galactopyranose mutase
MQPQYSIVVFSHLRWNFVYQRPQHLLSRLAANRPVFFVEEPEFDPSSPPHWERNTPQPNLQVLRPRTPIASPGFHPDQTSALESLISELAQELEGRPIVAWLYTPMALPLAQALSPSVVVYDCMDELSMFLGAPPELLSREAALIESADVMFTGGPSSPAMPTCTVFPAVWMRLTSRSGIPFRRKPRIRLACPTLASAFMA